MKKLFVSHHKGAHHGSFGFAHLVGAAKLLSVAAIMLGLSYAAVPLYQIYCQTSGFGGAAVLHQGEGNRGQAATTSTGAPPTENHPRGTTAQASSKAVGLSGINSGSVAPGGTAELVASLKTSPRQITINFNADVSSDLP